MRRAPVDDPEDVRMTIEHLDRMTDVVLGYRPKPKTKAAKRRAKKTRQRYEKKGSTRQWSKTNEREVSAARRGTPA